MPDRPQPFCPALLPASLFLPLFLGAGGCGESPLPSPVSDAAPAPSCSGKMGAIAGTTKRHILSGGKDRSYLLHVPPRYDPSQHTQLVLAFHGFTEHAEDHLMYDRMEPQSDSRNFLLVAPEGIGLLPGWNAGSCCVDPQIDDVGFVRAVLAEVRRDFCIDDHRVYAAGMSNGGFFTNRVGCELSADFAAIGPVSGGLLIPDCKISRPVSLMYFHGTGDTIVPYDGSALLHFPPALDTWHGWAMRDGCTGMPKETLRKGAVSCQTYGPCQEGSEASLCTITGGQHSWPGSPGANMDIDATTSLLDFFSRHVRP